MTAPESFVVVIVTRGRPDNVKTYRYLREFGYTGPIMLVIDDEDASGDRYRELYGDEVVTFHRNVGSEDFDTADIENRPTVIHARNAVPGLVAERGYRYHLVLDDDSHSVGHRDVAADGRFIARSTRRLDDVFQMFLDFLDTTGALTVAMAQGGDYIGGPDGAFRRRLLRKAMNSFFTRTDRPIGFVGRVNEDTNTYVVKGNRGELFFTFTAFYLAQAWTQTSEGGMTDEYLHSGTYVKSFYSVMMCPSAVKIAVMGNKEMRIHHLVHWRNAVPQIVSEQYRRLDKGAA